jgi:hypothetical protein
MADENLSPVPIQNSMPLTVFFYIPYDFHLTANISYAMVSNKQNQCHAGKVQKNLPFFEESTYEYFAQET